MASNLPPGAGRSSWATIDCECVNGHAWAAPAISELGGLFYVDDERGPFCPECRHIALDPDGQTFDIHELGEPMPGYELDADWVWRMPEPAEPDLVDPPEGCDDQLEHVLCVDCHEAVVMVDGYYRHERDGVDDDHRPRTLCTDSSCRSQPSGSVAP